MKEIEREMEVKRADWEDAFMDFALAGWNDEVRAKGDVERVIDLAVRAADLAIEQTEKRWGVRKRPRV